MILQCSHISKSFATDVVLNDVSFHINDNEKAAIVGVNGSGKSTLLKIIVGKEGYDSGDIIIKKDASVGYLAQNQEFESGESIIEEMQTAKPEVKILEKKMHELSEKMNNSSGDELWAGQTEKREYSALCPGSGQGKVNCPVRRVS